MSHTIAASAFGTGCKKLRFNEKTCVFVETLL